ESALPDMANYWTGQGPEGCGQRFEAGAPALALGRRHRDAGARQRFEWQRARSDLAMAGDDGNVIGRADCGGDRLAKAARGRRDVGFRAHKIPERWQRLVQPAGIAIELEHSFQGRQANLVDAQSALHRVLADTLDEI